MDGWMDGWDHGFMQCTAEFCTQMMTVHGCRINKNELMDGSALYGIERRRAARARAAAAVLALVRSVLVLRLRFKALDQRRVPA